MSKVIDQLKNHRVYREFDKDYELKESELQEILDAARQAPTWMNGQFYSIIVLKDQEVRKQLVEWNPGNPHMLESSVFLIFVADLKRTQAVSEEYNVVYDVTGNLDALITATTDAALACENAVVATESLGLGCVVVGSVRKHSQEIIKLLDLPEYTLPLFGLSIGKPTVEMRVKPRLPEETVVHYEKYQPLDYQNIKDYDETMETFREARETKLWSKKFADYFEKNTAEKTNQVLKEQKFI